MNLIQIREQVDNGKNIIFYNRDIYDVLYGIHR